MDRNLFLAILSMDSYNRGYGEALKPVSLNGNQVGDADLVTIALPEDARAVGFYAQVYNWNEMSYGDTLSYGDTCNNPQTSPDAVVPWGEGARSTRKRWERFRLDTQLLRSQSVAKLAEPD
jgi:hypothetical protein